MTNEGLKGEEMNTCHAIFQAPKSQFFWANWSWVCGTVPHHSSFLAAAGLPECRTQRNSLRAAPFVLTAKGVVGYHRILEL